MPESPLEPTPRTRVNRERKKVVEDRAALHAVLAEGLVAHVGVVRDGYPVVIPTAYAVDPDGPDADGTLYVHGSVAAGWLRETGGQQVCVTVTLLDGLVLARSGFSHSMNYRSAVILGEARLVDDPAERARALALIVDHIVPGRATELRPDSGKELAATLVLAVPLHEASVKARAGGPNDEPEDIAAGTWGGHLPLYLVAGEVVSHPATDAAVPAHVNQRAAQLSGPPVQPGTVARPGG